MPVLFFNYVGFELPSAAGDEMKNPQKDVPYTVLRAAITAILLYGLPILAVIAVLPKDEITGVDGFMTAVASVFTVWGGAVHRDDEDRRLRVRSGAGLERLHVADGLRPEPGRGVLRRRRAAVLGRFSAKLGTPVNVNFLSGVISSIVFVAAALVAGGNASATFDVMIGIVLTFTTISYIVIFPALIKLRYSHPHVNRPYRVPGGMVGVWICGVLCTFWAVFASLVAIFPGFLDGKLLNDSGLPEDVSRAKYTTIAAVAIGITLLAGLALLLARRAHARAHGRGAARGQRGARRGGRLHACLIRAWSAQRCHDGPEHDARAVGCPGPSPVIARATVATHDNQCYVKLEEMTSERGSPPDARLSGARGSRAAPP